MALDLNTLLGKVKILAMSLFAPERYAQYTQHMEATKSILNGEYSERFWEKLYAQNDKKGAIDWAQRMRKIAPYSYLGDMAMAQIGLKYADRRAALAYAKSAQKKCDQDPGCEPRAKAQCLIYYHDALVMNEHVEEAARVKKTLETKYRSFLEEEILLFGCTGPQKYLSFPAINSASASDSDSPKGF
jgi:hypothetical protein